MNVSLTEKTAKTLRIEQRIGELVGEMTVAEKIGQMNQVCLVDHAVPEDARVALRSGRIGSVLNVVNVEIVNELQRIAVEESRLGIPLLIGRDVIHGFQTVMPIPLGQAATWNPTLLKEGARFSAQEAAASGVNWTFAPMIDISRDPRWGRIAESFGEDPHLTSELGVAMVRGFQGDDLSTRGSIAACAKHFAGYGDCESGRDYATTNIPENELRNVHLRPFRATVDAGVATIMASFSDLNGIPATASEFLMRQVLRDEWQFDGFVVSDFDSISQLCVHGLTENDKDAALQAVTAGIDMEMAGACYTEHLESLIDEGRVDIGVVDELVGNILRVKFRLGLFEDPYTNPSDFPSKPNADAMRAAKTAALQSVVMLKNDHDVLPLSCGNLRSIAVIGPLADAPYEQLGTWIFDGDPALSITCLQGVHDMVGDAVDVRFVRAMDTSRSRDTASFDEAVRAAQETDLSILFLGEESILTGEAHSRADIDLPGAQVELIRRIRKAGKKVIVVILAGRPLTLTNIVDEVDAILYAWHPGTMGGTAIAELLFGIESPSGKLPATMPRMVGQIPIYYNQKNTGKPPRPHELVFIDDIAEQAPQTSFGMFAFHLDAGFSPLFPFGYGLSYAKFEYKNIRTSIHEVEIGDKLTVSAELTNNGEVGAVEVAQLYVRDLVASVTRPVRELKGFKRVYVESGQTITVEFELQTSDLAFYGRDYKLVTEPGEFRVWIGGSSYADLQSEFQVIARQRGA